MISYLLESSVCLAAFYGLYWLALSKAKLLNLNRAYLLAAAGLSLLIPLISIPILNEPALAAITYNGRGEGIATTMASNPNGLFINPWILIYLIGLLISITSLVKSIWSLLKLLKNPKIKAGEFWHVPTSEKEISSFLRYIFLPANFQKEAKDGRMALAHERVHLKELHSLDLIFFQLLSVVFWFNPFIYAYKRAIRLQHEYIADDAVSKAQGREPYSQCLIEMTLSKAGFSLTHSFSQHPVEKRLKMIETINPTNMKKLKPLFSLPLIACLLFTFSFDKAVQAQDPIEKKKAQVIDVMAKTDDTKALRIINGRVHAFDSGKAIDKVTVFFRPSNSGSLTNAEGKFKIVPQESDTLIVFRKKGYDDITVPVKNYEVVNVNLTKKTAPENIIKKGKKGNN